MKVGRIGLLLAILPYALLLFWSQFVSDGLTTAIIFKKSSLLELGALPVSLVGLFYDKRKTYAFLGVIISAIYLMLLWPALSLAR